MIIFIHIAKTGGTWLIKSIENLPRMKGVQFKEPVQNLLDKEDFVPDKKQDIVVGHIPFGYHKLFQHDKVQYITFVREPTERWVSSICHSIQDCSDNPIKTLYKQSPSLTSFLRQCLKRQINYNVMTRQLSGLEDMRNLISVDKQKSGAMYVPHLCVKSLYNKKQMIQMIRAAEKNLNQCAFVGRLEHLQRDAVLLARQFGWKLTPHKKKLRQTKRIITLSQRDKDLVRQMNEYDYMLYKHVCS